MDKSVRGTGAVGELKYYFMGSLLMWSLKRIFRTAVDQLPALAESLDLRVLFAFSAHVIFSLHWRRLPPDMFLTAVLFLVIAATDILTAGQLPLPAASGILALAGPALRYLRSRRRE